MTETKRKATKRRGNGEGSIFQRADGKWATTLTVGYNQHGKRIRKTLYGATKREVQEKLSKLHGQRLDGTLVESGTTTLAQFLDKWLEDSVRISVRPATFDNYGHMVTHIKAKLGGAALSKLTAIHIQGMYAELEREGKKPRLRQLIHAVLSRSLRTAVRWGLLARNLCDAVERPSVPKHEITPLDEAQAQQFLAAAADDRLYALYVLAITTGLRQGELLGLQWPDINLGAGVLSVQRTLLERNGVHSFGEPKTSRSKRLVSLPGFAIEALWAHKAKMLAEGFAATELVFCGERRGGPLFKGNIIRRSFRPLLKSTGLPAIRFHDLRHTAATLLLSQGVHPKVVQERLGHSSISVTMDIYSHVLPSMQREAADRLDGLFRKTGT